MKKADSANLQNESWPLAGARRGEEGKGPFFKRLFARLHRWIAAGVSNLRMSLTLRIALHYAGQLLKTTLPALAAVAVVLIIAETSAAQRELDRISQLLPEAGDRYSAEQLLGSPFAEVSLTSSRLPEGFSGLTERIRLGFSEFSKENQRILFCVEIPQGGLIGVYSAEKLVKWLSLLFWGFVLADLYRVVHFLNHRNGLNRKVLKPISDMAQIAARLSANNLSDRISVEGAKNELKDLAMVINSMLDRIELSYNSQKQFVSDASHELRTPIAVIQGYVSMLKRWGKTDPDVLEEGISAIAQEADSMKELVERLLFLARHDKKTLLLEVESFDPLEVMSEIHREAKMLSSDHCFALHPAQNAWISGDKDMIKQLMRILLENAIKYTPAGGSITLGVKKEKNGCLLTVSDTGEGISAEDLPKVFDRFYRCEGARKSQTSGHGFGLSIARIIVSAHGGKLKVRSKPGAGTTFFVWLPQDAEKMS